MTESIRNEIKQAIEDFLWNEDKNEVLTEEKIKDLAELYVSFVERAGQKYIRGQEEHGGNLGDRDCAKELFHELVDGVHYLHEIMKKAKLPPSAA
jgi:hypothetical protein